MKGAFVCEDHDRAGLQMEMGNNRVEPLFVSAALQRKAPEQESVTEPALSLAKA